MQCLNIVVPITNVISTSFSIPLGIEIFDIFEQAVNYDNIYLKLLKKNCLSPWQHENYIYFNNLFFSHIQYKREICSLLFPKRQISRPVQIESIRRRQNKSDSEIEFFVGMSRKHCGKRRKCW